MTTPASAAPAPAAPPPVRVPHATAPVATLERIDEDSTAVLAFDDGRRVPCDRYLMRVTCGVLAELMASGTSLETDDRGRTVVPVPGQPSAPFAAVVEMIHSARYYGDLGLADTLGALRAVEYLGCATFELLLDAHLLDLALASPPPPFEAVFPHVPRLLRHVDVVSRTTFPLQPRAADDSPDKARRLVHALVRAKPTWRQFRDDVLVPMASSGATRDARVSRPLVRHACDFFPPAPVVCWALASGALDGPSALEAAHAAGAVHPGELPAVLRALEEGEAGLDGTGRPASRHGFGPGAAYSSSSSAKPPPVLPPGTLLLARLAADLLDPRYCASAPSASVRGTIVRCQDPGTTSVSLVLDAGRRDKTHALAPWLTVRLTREGSLRMGVDLSRMSRRARGGAVAMRATLYDSRDDYVGETWLAFARGAGFVTDVDGRHLAGATLATLGALASGGWGAPGRLRLDWLYDPDLLALLGVE